MYQGKFKCSNPQKYLGDPAQIYYRSSWELSVMVWCDKNPKVVSWSSEELVIPYLCPTDGNQHRYFVDFVINFNNGNQYWVEIKPHKQTIPPKKPKKQSKKYITEVMTYAKNQAKWSTASEYAKQHNASFQIWTENTLKSLGIKVLGK